MEGGQCGAHVVAASDDGEVEPHAIVEDWEEVAVEIVGGVGEGCEDDDLAVAGIDGVVYLGLYVGYELL